MHAPQRRRGFTLIELLIVIAILGVLTAMLLPAVQSSRMATRRLSCLNQFKQLGLAVLNYEASRDALPLAYTPNWTGGALAGDCPGKTRPGNPPNGLRRHNWIAQVLPFFEQQALFDRIDFRRDWNDDSSSDNLAAISTILGGLYCPSAPSIDERRGRLVHPSSQLDYGVAATDYTVCIDIYSTASGAGFCELVDAGLAAPRDLQWLEGMMQDHQPSLRKVTDGLSRTFMLFENAGRPLQYLRGEQLEASVTSSSWANPDSYMVYGLSKTCGMDEVMNCSNWDELYSFHPGGANFLYGDGSARFHTENLEVELFVSLFTRAGGEAVDDLP